MSWTTNVRRSVLPNGLTVLVQRDAAAPVVAVVTHVRAGYFDEPDDWVGIAHVLEHMYFKGTARRGPGDIARETQRVGGYINAGTIYDKTVYYTVLPAAAGGLEHALDVQADALMHSALDSDELQRELEVIIQEAKRKLDTPGAVTTERLYELLFRAHRMRRWRIGTEEGLRRLGPSDVRGYYETRYTPDRVIVGIVGDLEPDRALALATDTFGEWNRPPTPFAGSPMEPEERSAGVRVLRGDVERPLASIGWRTVGALHPDAPALDVAATILGGGRGARLYRALRVPGIAASVHAGHYTPTEVGVFELSLEADGPRLDESVQHAWDLSAELADHGPSDLELERARALIATSWARRHEPMDTRGAALCEAEALGGYVLVDELLQRTLDVTAEDVRRVVSRHLPANGASAVLYLTRDGATRLADRWPPSAPAAAGLPAVRVPAFLVEGDVGPARPWSTLPGGVAHCSQPGIDLLLRPKRGSGVVTVMLQLPGAPSHEAPDNAGISLLLVRSALRGAGSMGEEDLAQAAELLGGAVTSSVSAETMGWSMTVRAGALREAAAILRALALAPHLDQAAIEVERVLQASDARRVRDDMFRYPVQQVLAQAFPGDPYGLPTMGEPDVVSRIGSRDLRWWLGEVTGLRPVVVAVGDFEVGAALDALAPLAGWESAGRTVRLDAPPTWVPGRGAERREKEQSALAVAFPAVPFGSPDHFPVKVLCAVLSGLAGRLFDELRDRRSLAYTVAAIPWLARRAGAVLCYIATSPDREEEARDAMLGELQRLRREPPSGEELERARNYTAGAVEIRRQSGAALASEILDAWMHGVPEALAEAPARLRAVTREDVARLVESVFVEDRRAEYVVRGGVKRGDAA